MHHIVTQTINTPFGEMLAGATSQGICMLEFTDTGRLEMQRASLKKSFSAKIIEAESKYFKPLRLELNAYFEGKLQNFEVPLDINGSPFQIQAWHALLKIPYGETRSYQQQAHAIDKPKAFRAVASANRKNRISILIPCHRVIAKNGNLAGYGGGLDRKQFLLNLENK